MGMKKLLALGVVVALLFGPLDVYADYAAPFSVQFEAGSSRLAGEEATLTFSLPAEASYKYIAVDFGESGFVPTGTVSLWIESWPNKLELESTNTVNDHAVELLFPKVPDNAWSLNVSITVQNPTKAQRVSVNSITVKAGAKSDSLQVVPSMGSFLDIGLRVTANITKGIVGTQETVQFRVLEGNTVCDEPLRFTLKRNNKVLSSAVIPNGSLNLPLYFYYDVGKHSANYTFEVSKVNQAQVKGAFTLPIAYDLTTGVPTDAVYLGEAEIYGVVKDGTGRGVAGVPVSIVNKGAPYSPVATVTSGSDGSFTINAKFMDAAVHAVAIAGTEYAQFSVRGVPLVVTVAQPEVPSNAVSTSVELSVLFDGRDVSQAVEIKVIGPDGKTVLDWSAGNPWGSYGQAATVRKIDIGKLPLAGGYNILARYEDVDGGETTDIYDGTGSATFKVRTTTVVVSAGSLEADLMAIGQNSITVKATDAAGAGVKDEATGRDVAQVRFTVSGAVAEQVVFDSSQASATFDQAPVGNVQKTVPITVTQAGTVLVQGQVNLADGTVEAFSKAFVTNGWVIKTSQIVGIVGEEVLIRAVVHTPQGIPVNHAKVVWQSNRAAFEVRNTWGGYSTSSRLEIDGLASNVQNGIYEIRAKLLQSDDLVAVEVTRVKDSAIRAQFVTRIAEGNVYRLKAEPTTLIATLDHQRLELSYANQKGRSLNGDATLLVTGPGVNASFVTAADWDTPQLTITPTAVGDITVEGSPQDKSRFLPLVIPVRAPNVHHNLGTYATENMWQDLTLRGQDFSYGGVLPIYVRISSEGAQMALNSTTGAYIERDGTGVSQTFTTYASTEHRFRLMPWVSSPAEGVTPVVRIEASYNGRDWVVVHEAPIKPIVIACHPSTVYIGVPDKLDVTVTDANGSPYAGKRVDVQGQVALTNAQGKVSFAINPSGTHLIPIRVTLDRLLGKDYATATVYVESKVPQ